MEEKIFTNCFLVKLDAQGKPRQVCLAMKKRGFGVGRYNGSGGKPENGEAVDKATLREVEEEFGIKVTKLEKRGEISFILKKEDKHVLMHTFLTTEWEGEPVETEEMKPEWFDVDKIPYELMWKSDREWLPLILEGKKINAEFTYAFDGGEVETRAVTEAVFKR